MTESKDRQWSPGTLKGIPRPPSFKPVGTEMQTLDSTQPSHEYGLSGSDCSDKSKCLFSRLALKSARSAGLNSFACRMLASRFISPTDLLLLPVIIHSISKYIDMF